MKRAWLLLAGLVALPAHAAPVGEGGLVTQLATDHVDITARFTGQEILIFGALSRRGDVIVRLRAPDQVVALSRKAKFGPFWLNSGKLDVDAAPGLLYVLASAPVKKLLDVRTRERYGLTLEHAVAKLRIAHVPEGMEDWRDALLQLKKQDHYYLQDGHAVTLVSDRLFFTRVDLPAKIPLGVYRLDIYLVRGGRIVGHQSRTLEVRQVRLERWVSDVAHGYPWTFGVLFTVLAMGLGLALGIVLRRDGDS
ncbi:MAG: hypothetical protein B7Z66_00785 [Chromatiales bacterium 21-64-14]|nr:MAG: hypothetical protein B7Z66_00785 [Chromatiales bacterium 21-64-14]HQU15567.1 TIGR02186 family protein [Gammaproteobacteria bacterium]